MLYRGMDRAALDAAYNNRNAVGSAAVERHYAAWQDRTKRLNAAHQPEIDLRYGAGARERLDFYKAAKPNGPTLIFIHGGYWQMNDKELFSFIAEGPLAHDVNVAVVEYTLAPAARMDQICAEIRRSVDWLLANLARLGGDPDKLYVSGHSAGGHLTSIAMDNPRLAGGIAISGIFDLEPIRLNYLNDKLGLDVAEAERNSTIKHLPTRAGRLIVSVGARELPELVRQSEEYAKAWTAGGRAGSYLPLAGHDHFSILEELAQPNGKLTQALLDLIARR
ncbi:MAG TPA: alpha/beta hydrolase [Candidatus Sulfotelmatobacter sp.]|nr:alpha/beta hydrolase [Candidatus Sulfotelmatobacter sp.]